MPDALPIRTARAQQLQDWLEAARPLFRWEVGELATGYYVAVEADIDGVARCAYTELDRQWLEGLLKRDPRAADRVAVSLLHAMIEWRPSYGR